MIRDLPHIYSRIFGVPLLISAGKLDALLGGLNAARLQRGSPLVELSEPGILAPEPQPERPTYGYRLRNGIATVPVHGVLVKRHGQVDADSTVFQSYERLTQILRNVRADNRARAILLDIDSPGGEAGGIFDFAAEVRSIGASKPVWAIANDDALSAAYVIAAAADRVWITETGAAGSLGVVALHRDQSQADDQLGLAYSYIFKGAHKIDGNPHAPLTIEARTAIQGEIDRLYDKLAVSVAAHRRLPPEQLRATEARVYYAENARAEGLADQIGNLDQAHAALAESVTSEASAASAKRFGAYQQGGAKMDSEDTNVVNLDEVRSSAAAEATAAALEIADLCRLAGHLELVGEFIGKGMLSPAVRHALIELKAREDQARPIEAIDTSAAGAAASRAANSAGEAVRANADRFRAYQTPVRGAF